MRFDLVREVAGLVLGALGAGCAIGLLVLLIAAGRWISVGLMLAGAVLIVAGWQMARWDPAAREARRAVREADRARAELHRIDPDAVIRER